MSQSFVDIQVTNSIILALDMLYTCNLIGVCVCVVGLGLDRPPISTSLLWEEVNVAL